MTVSNKLRKELNKKIGRKRFVTNFLLVFAFSFATIFIGVYGGIQAYTTQQVFAKNVLIDSVQVGGLRMSEAEKLVKAHEQQFMDSVALTVVYEGENNVFGAKDIATSSNVDEVLQQAYDYNKTSASAFDNFQKTLEPLELKTSLSLDQEKLYENMQKVFSKYEVPPVDATAEFQKMSRDFDYIEGSEGKSVDIDQLCRDITSNIEKSIDKPVVAVTKILMPRFTRQSLEENSQLVGEYKTAVDDNEERILNMQLMCSAINGTEIMPGETISLNALSGGHTQENGYVEASVEADGKKQGKEVGGGVGQFASTFYCAGLMADMEVVERQKNLWTPSYVKVGLDASLNYDDIDLKMKNRSNFPMFIGASLSESVLKIEVYGQSLENKIEIESRELNYVEAPHAEVVYTEDYPQGEQHEKSKSREGYEVEIYRHYLENGRTISSELISHDIYNEIRGVILQGTGN